MKHIDEHIIELYVLGDSTVAPQRDVIKGHLLECSGCRALEQRVISLYADAERIYAQLPELETSLLPVKSRQRAGLTSVEETGIEESRPVRRGLWKDFRAFAIIHPLATVAGGALSLAAIAGIVAMTVNALVTVPSPSFVQVNPDQNALEVFGEDFQKLWTIPTLPIHRWEQENEAHKTSRVEVADLRGDGSREVVTTVPLAGMSNAFGWLRVFDSHRRLTVEREIGGPVNFRGTRYSDHMEAWALTIVRDSTGKGSNIIVAASAGHSPTVIARVDANGDILGEYWHFGTLCGVYGIELNGDGREVVLAAGTSDIADSADDVSRSRAVMLVIDPLRLVGRQESRFTPGFGFSPSDAERVYIQFPCSDMENALRVSSGVRYVRMTPDSLLLVKVESGGPLRIPVFDYTFTKDLQPVSVQSIDYNADLHAKLKAEGKIQSHLDKAYLDNLMARIEFHTSK